MNITAWREETQRKDEMYYKVQINQIIGARSRKKVEKLFGEWKLVGEGYSMRNSKESLLMYAKTFKTRKEWETWAKQFPHELTEYTNHGNPKVFKATS
jgi:hypothetical protein